MKAVVFKEVLISPKMDLLFVVFIVVLMEVSSRMV